MGKFLGKAQTITRGGFFGGAAPGGQTVFSIFSADNSTGPIPAFIGSGEGYYDGATNGSISCGAVTPNPAFFRGNRISVFAFQGGPSPRMVFTLYGTLASNLFTQITYTDKAAPRTLTNAAATFSTTVVAGFSTWYWPAPLNQPFTNGTTYPITVTP